MEAIVNTTCNCLYTITFRNTAIGTTTTWVCSNEQVMRAEFAELEKKPWITDIEVKAAILK